MVAGCGSTPSPAPRAPRAATQHAYEGPLTALLPPGADVLIVARPADVYASPALSRVALSIVDEERLETYAVHTGIDPRRLTELVYATYGEEVVLIVRGPFDAPFAVREMAELMLPVESEADSPFMRRSGHYQSARRDLVALSPHTLLAITGTPMMAGEVVTRARPGGSATGLLQGPNIASLLAQHTPSPFVFMLPQPLNLPRDTGVGLLLAREEALVVAATAGSGETVAMTFDLRGEFPPGAADNFRALATSLAQSDMGAALGMREALPTLGVDASDTRAVIDAQIPVAAVAAGLHLLFAAEIEDAVGQPTAESERPPSDRP